MSPSAAGFLHVGVAQLLELFDQSVAVVALDLDHAVLHRAASAALLLERAAQFFELRARQRHALDGAHAFATAMRGLLPDADGDGFAGIHAFPSRLIQRSMRSSSNVSNST